VSDSNGRFDLEPSPEEMYVLAQTEDQSLAGIVRQAAAESCVIAVAPTASLRGRIVDVGTGQPLENHRVFYGIVRGNVPSMGWELGASVTTDAKGEFSIKGLVPGWEYRLTATTRPMVHRHVPRGMDDFRPTTTIGNVKPERSEVIGLGDVKIDVRRAPQIRAPDGRVRIPKFPKRGGPACPPGR
jgi:hypothetical protein